MRFSDISEATINKLRKIKFDQLLEKHEGPWEWDTVLKYFDPEFIKVEDYFVLLPLDKSHHANIGILRCITSEDKATLTIFLKDITHYEGIFSGHVAICEKYPGEEFYLCIFYHE